MRAKKKKPYQRKWGRVCPQQRISADRRVVPLMVTGEATVEDFYAAISEWERHSRSSRGMTLCEYLGFTVQEHWQWIKSHRKCLPEIIRQRQNDAERNARTRELTTLVAICDYAQRRTGLGKAFAGKLVRKQRIARVHAYFEEVRRLAARNGVSYPEHEYEALEHKLAATAGKSRGLVRGGRDPRDMADCQTPIPRYARD